MNDISRSGVRHLMHNFSKLNSRPLPDSLLVPSLVMRKPVDSAASVVAKLLEGGGRDLFIALQAGIKRVDYRVEVLAKGNCLTAGTEQT